MSEQPMYSGWRRARAMGLGNLDARNSLVLAASVALILVCTWIWGVRALPFVLPLAALGVALALTHVQGVWVLDLVAAWVGYTRARSRGQTAYRAQLWAPYPRRWDLPGVLARSRLLDYKDPARGNVGLVWDPRSGKMSATYLLSPTGALLADQQTVSHQVGAWGQTLASLADETAISHAVVTIELVPAAGTDLAEHVQGRVVAGAPPLAQQMMAEVLSAAPSTTTRIRARMTLTVDTHRTSARGLDEATTETLRSLGGLSLSAAGVDVLRRASANDLVQVVRGAFDPASEEVNDPALWAEQSWSDAGPVAAQEEWGYYVHDGAYSATWCMVEAPRQMVTHDVLLPLLLPPPGPYVRRLSILYRTLSREQAGKFLHRQQNAASARRYWDQYSGKDSTARDEADAQRANRAAAEEAQGAGIVEFSLLVTVTCSSLEELEEARRHTVQAASQARLRMRPCWGSQAASFAVGLGVAGLYPPDL